MEVPTILYFLKQTADIPVPRGRGRRLQGFLLEQSFRIFSGGLQGSRPGQGSTASSSSSVSRSPTDVLNAADEAFEGVFTLFLGRKKSARVAAQWSARVHAHPSPPELSAHQMSSATSDDITTWRTTTTTCGCCWTMRTASTG